MDNERVEALKGIITQLHDASEDERKELSKRFKSLAHLATPMEIAEAEQQSISEGIPLEDVRKLCDVHLDMFVDDARERRTKLDPGHPVSIMYDEHDVILDALRKGRNAMSPTGGDKPAPDVILSVVREITPVMENAERNFVKQENAFFPVVEKHGITQPPAIMWSEHDEMRSLFKEFLSLGPDDRQRAGEVLLQAEELMATHVRKEETILFQSALSLFSSEEWNTVRHDFDELGYVHSDVAGFQGAGAGSGHETGSPAGMGGKVALPSGSFTTEQLLALFNTLPVDITLVDADDKVAFFSESSERIFPRARSVIGRSVQNCHPPKSVHVVQEILDSFRAGDRDCEEFYLHLGEKYVYIRYFALRDTETNYLGCLEVGQDIAPIQAISGEKRIL